MRTRAHLLQVRSFARLRRWCSRAALAGLCIAACLLGPGVAAGVALEEMTAEVAQVDTTAYPDVTVYVRVLDSAGRIVEGLEKEMFTLTEDGQPVEIIAFEAGSRAAISTVLTLDRSRSMDVEGKLAGAKDAAHTFVDLMREQDQVAVVAFDDTVVTLQPFTNDKGKLSAAIDGIKLGDCTAWYDAIYDSVGLIEKLDGRRSVILLSDGIDCRDDVVRRLLGHGSEHTLDAAIEAARQAEIPVYAIGLGAEATTRTTNEGYDEGKLRRVAEQTGGKFYHTPSAAELKALYRELSWEMQREYAVTYRSPRPTYDGTRRNIGVTISDAGGAGATTQGGYLEQHLLNIHASPLVFAAFLLPLVVLLVAPLAPRWKRAPGRERPATAAERQPGSAERATPAPVEYPPAQQYLEQAPPFAPPPAAPSWPALAARPLDPPQYGYGAAPLAAGAPTVVVVRYALDPSPVTIGSSPINSVVVGDARANHAVIEQRAGRYVVRDLSGGETFVSFRGDPAQETPTAENALRDGSTIRCGATRLTVRVPAAAAAWLEQSFPLTSGMTLGAAGSTIQLPAAGAGHAQVEIVREGARWVVVDAGGGSGLQVSFSGDPAQMRPLNGRNAIKAGSLVRIGQGPRVLLEFRAA